MARMQNFSVSSNLLNIVTYQKFKYTFIFYSTAIPSVI